MVSILIASAFASSGLAQKGTWTTIAPMPIGVAFGANGVVMDGKFYVFDGTNGTSHAPQVYDPLTNSWSVKVADPVVRSESSAGVIGDKIYVAEGWINSDSNNSTTALEIYDPATNSWTAGPSSLVSRGLSATAVIDGKLYIAAGTATGYTNFRDLEIYDPVTNSWSEGMPLSKPLTSAAGAAVNGKFYVLGGYVGPSAFDNTITAHVGIYDPILNTWSEGNSMPTARANMVVGVLNGGLCVTGGVKADGTRDSSTVFYDPTTDKWSLAAAELTARASAIAAVVGYKFYVAGGNTDGGNYTPTAEVFTLRAAGAIGVPGF